MTPRDDKAIQEKRGLFRDLLDRRVPQITGIYLGGSWGVLQFLDWIVKRYLLSPLLVDLALTVLASLLPTIVIIAYFHGSPGKNRWRKTEKIFIPVNMVLMIILVFTLFGNKNLSSVARRVSVTDETGKKVENVVPRKGVVKDMAIFYFDNRSGQMEAEWLQYGLVGMLDLDLSQDPFVNFKTPSKPDLLEGYHIFQKFRDAGFSDATGSPLMLQNKIATDLNTEYFLSGSILKTAGETELACAIHRTRDNSVLAENIFKSTDIFSLVDQLTLFIKKSLKLPSYKNREIVDLPVKDMYTDSEEAARLATRAEMEIIKKNDYSAAQKLLERAIKEDETFAFAYMELAQIYAMNNLMDQWISTNKMLMNYLYRLPEKMRMQLKAGYYLEVKQEPEKAVSLLKMITKLYPSDISNYTLLARRFHLTGHFDEAVVYYKKVLELEPSRLEIYKKLGEVYESKGDFENAFACYKKYSRQYPKDPDGFLKMGEIEEKRGHFKEAAEWYERALLLEPEEISTILTIAGLDIKSGKFKSALDKYAEALASARNSREKSAVYRAMKDYYRHRGQPARAMEMMEKFYSASEDYLPPLQVLIMKVVSCDIFLENGRTGRVKSMLDRARDQLSSPFDKIVSMGYIIYYLHTRDLDKAESYLPDIHTFVEKTGNRSFLILADIRKAGILRLRGDYEGALNLYEKTFEQNPDSVSILNAMAGCLREMERFDEGIGVVRKALKMSPHHPTANYTAARLYFVVNKKDRAREHLQRALKGWETAEPGFEDARDARNLFKQLDTGAK